MMKQEALGLPVGTKLYCTVHGAEGWYTLLAIRPRDGYLKLSGEKMWCPPHNFQQEAPKK